MRIEVKMTEVLVHLTIDEAASVRDDMEASEIETMADLIRRAMPSAEDEAEDEDDDWEPWEDDDDEEDEDDDPVAKYDDDALEDK